MRNRVLEIQELTSPSTWYHCPGKDNPADLISRDTLAEDLVSSEMWLDGPAWLSLPIQHPQQEQYMLSSKEDSEEEVATSCLTVTVSHSSVFEFGRWGEFCKAVRVVAWVLRFIRNCKLRGERCTGPLMYEELSKAKMNLFQCVQREAYDKEFEFLSQGKAIPQSSSLGKLDPFIDVDGLLRVKGRLDQADVIPSGHVAQLLIRFQHLMLKHAGVSVL